MKIERATYDALDGLAVWIDGLGFAVGEKRTFIDLGYALLMRLSLDVDEKRFQRWMAENCKKLPPTQEFRFDSKDWTDEPVIVEIAQRAWHGELDEGEVQIPSHDEAVAALKRRGVPKLLDGRPARIHDGIFEPVP